MNSREKIIFVCDCLGESLLLMSQEQLLRIYRSPLCLAFVEVVEGNRFAIASFSSLPSFDKKSVETLFAGLILYRTNGCQDAIKKECDRLKEMLLEKNRMYGDSVLSPIRVFSRASANEQILVRLDDKLNRLLSRQLDDKEDVLDDLLGYLVLFLVNDLLGERKNFVHRIWSSIRKHIALAIAV